ncbi:MAG: ATP synthase subunit I [Candidatus Dadabacteria bacterium]|nr:ATP synthase subunit I [Candidatus Dadabacteria bacterium]
MAEKAESLINIPSIGRVEKGGLLVTAILVAVTYLLGYQELAFGIAAGGILFTANFVAIRFIVNALVANSHPMGFGIFAVIIKMLIFMAIVVSIFMFAEINIYGFFIGVSAIVIIIVGESLRGGKDGTL